jgi:uncharacterized coiled-coil protein SlyX
MTDPTLPPVGATVDALAMRILSAAADWNCYLHSTRGYDPVAPVQSVTHALETAATALRALVAERDQLKARVAELEGDAAYSRATIEILSDEVREVRERYTALRALVRDVADSQVDPEVAWIGYVTVNVDRHTWAEVRNV